MLLQDWDAPRAGFLRIPAIHWHRPPTGHVELRPTTSTRIDVLSLSNGVIPHPPTLHRCDGGRDGNRQAEVLHDLEYCQVPWMCMCLFRRSAGWSGANRPPPSVPSERSDVSSFQLSVFDNICSGITFLMDSPFMMSRVEQSRVTRPAQSPIWRAMEGPVGCA